MNFPVMNYFASIHLFTLIKMKKIIASMCTLAVLFSISACATAPQNVNVSGQTNEQFKEEGPVWTQELMQGYLNRDTDSVMAYAGPFYFNSFDGIAPNSQAYSEQRREKVEEIVEVIDEGIDVMAKLDKKLREEREIFDWYIKEIQTIDKGTKVFTDQVLGATKGNILSENLSALMVMNMDAAEMEKNADWGFLQFQVYGNWIDLTNLYTVEAASLMSRATAMYYLLESDPNTAYQDLNVQFIAKMDPVSEQASELLSELYYMTALARNGEKIIFTADYNFAKATLKDIDDQITKAQKAFDDYQGGNENLSEGMLALLKSELEQMIAYRDSISDYLDSIPAEELVKEGEFAMADHGSAFALIPIARAQMDIPGWFQQKVKDTIKTARFVKDMSMAAVRVTGQKIKDVYDKSGAHEVVKDGAQIFNGGLEIVNSGVEVSIHGIQGIYYGDMSWDDFKKKMESEKNELYEKFVQAKLGKEQFDEMIHQMDQFKKNTDRFVENMSEFAGDLTGILTGQPKVGKFVKDVTKSVGSEAKGALDTATEFSKNLAIVMHPETSKEDTRKALMDIYATLKKTRDDKGKLKEVEIPDLADLTKEKALEQAVKDLGLEQEEEKEFIDELKDLFKEQLKDKETPDADKKTDTKKTDVTKDATGKTATDRVVEELIKNPDMTDEQIADLIIAEIIKDLPPVKGKTDDADKEEEEAKDTDEDGVMDDSDNCKNDSNADQSDYDKDGLGDVCDPDCSGDVDGDEVCNEVDNCPQDPNPDQADADNDAMGNVCDMDAPLIGEIAGTWPGTITVTEVYFTDEFRAQAEAEGCDISEVEQSKDIPKPVSITINPTSETGGEIIMSGADQGEQTIPFTYVDGVLKAAQSDESASMNIEMNFGRDTSTGKVDLDYLSGSAKIQAELDLKK